MRTLISTAALAAVTLLGAGLEAQADDIALTNPSFDDNGFAARTVGDATWSNIDGWSSTGPSVDSGVEIQWIPSSQQAELGTQFAFLQSGDGAMYQTTGHTIQSGDNYLVTFYDFNGWYATETTVSLYYESGGVRNYFSQDVIDVSYSYWSNGGYGTDLLGFKFSTAEAPPEAVGYPLGIEFENTSAGGATGTWSWIDGVTLQTTGGPGDVNIDGVVDYDDYEIIRDNFRNPTTSRAYGRDEGDLDLSGTVDFADFIEWRDNATPAALAQAGFLVPEPSTAVLALGALAMAARRRS